jgi:tetratricopeptide (TPR) repeat protein
MTTPEVPINQTVTAVAGFAYGVIGADLHVFGDGSPLYILENWRPAPAVDSELLRELPSRMLNAHNAVVKFTGRADELSDLHAWREAGHRLAVRWLYGPGGQGKSRLAARFAEDCLSSGWKVVNATHGPGVIHEAHRQEDLRLDGAAGLLLVVDYADRWPITHLTWLLSNALLHQIGVRTRVMLLARTLDAWPRVAATFANQNVSTSAQALAQISDEHQQRETMFTAARDSFAVHYRMPAPERIPPPDLSQPDFGLVLGIHMAALVAVDSVATGNTEAPPSSVEGCTIYLLNREHLHWALMHSPEAHRLDRRGRTFLTPPDVMNLAVFVAALTGPRTTPAAVAVMEKARQGTDAVQVIADHTVCYPPLTHDSALEPLYPDRLAEDFIALTIPGHRVAYPSQSWAQPTAELVSVGGEEASAEAGASISRLVLFLAVAAARWPHVGAGCLFPILRKAPRLAFDAGGAALTALAELPGIDIELLDLLAVHIPEGQHVDLDVGVAVLVRRATEHHLPRAEPLQRAKLLSFLGQRLAYAGRYSDAAATTAEAIAILREGGGRDPRELAGALNDLSNVLSSLGKHGEAVKVLGEAIAIQQDLLRLDPSSRPFGSLQPEDLAVTALAEMLSNQARLLNLLGDPDEAKIHVEKAVTLGTELAIQMPSYAPNLAGSLSMLATTLSELGRFQQALGYELKAIEILRPLADAEPSVHLPALADSVNNVSVTLSYLGLPVEAMPFAQEAAEAGRRLAEANKDKYLPSLGGYLNNLGARHTELGQYDQALNIFEEAAEIWHRLTASGPEAHLPGHAMALHNLSNAQVIAGTLTLDDLLARQGLETARQALTIQRRLAAADPAAHMSSLAEGLSSYGFKLAQAGEAEEGLSPAAEALAIFRGLAVPAGSVELATALLSIAAIGIQAGVDIGAARAALLESTAMWRGLMRDAPGVHEGKVAGLLVTYVVAARSAGNISDTEMNAIDEAVEIYSEVVRQAEEPDQALAMLNLAVGLRSEIHQEPTAPDELPVASDVPPQAVVEQLRLLLASMDRRPSRPRRLLASVPARLIGITAGGLVIWTLIGSRVSLLAPVWLEFLTYLTLAVLLYLVAKEPEDRSRREAPKAATLAFVLATILGATRYLEHGYAASGAGAAWAWSFTVIHLTIVVSIAVRTRYIARWFRTTMKRNPLLGDRERGLLAQRPRWWRIWETAAVLSALTMIVVGLSGV